jgi:hypothetical protein
LWLAAIPAPPKGSNRAAAIAGGTRHAAQAQGAERSTVP